MPELQPGDPRRLGSYEIVERLGEGGQGVVYAGVDASGNRAAIKLLRTDLAADAGARNRFVREAQAAKQVARFCTAQVLEADVAGDQPYIASEYVPGPSLYKQVTETGPITGAALDRLAIGTATALVAIHQAGIVHRDFKPHNVIMAPDGPRVIDFGIARALDTGQTNATKAIGTPSYMAPEQVAGATLTEAVDVWAWATTMVFAATGHPPFGDDTVVAVINRVMNEPPYLEGVPADLHRLVAACLVKEPERRPTAQQLMMALIGSGPGGAGQTRMDDPGQATTMLAEGSTLAAGAGAAAAFGAHQGGPHGGQTQRVSPANYTGTLPPVQQPPYRGGGRHTGYDDFEPERRSKWPIFAGIAAIAVLALVVGLFMANRGGDDTPGTGTSPTVSDSSSVSDSPTEDQPTQDQPTYTRPTRPRHTAPTRLPTSEAPTSEAPTSEAPTSEAPTSHSPTTNPTHTSGGGGGGGDGSGGGGGGGGGAGTGG
ncbi:serine/threonine-protein kinase [Spirillospora sp. NPDC000708]|jgi:serine/threonine protein kinase|uniref:serine/threonine-protein kinase n=1 Tax=Actinomadura TaxID=1988 RepID=UPI0016826A87|nr:serine/threonine-protein kinase [Actinomadura sp. RB99]MBD2896419.1 Serine/threonine-protein kinase PknD [Actinomadura sp. RB99]